MERRDEVEQFLKDFHFKLDFWGVFIRLDRTNLKNTHTLLALELNRAHVKEILKKLIADDYSQGPLPDTLYHNSDMWVFGKIICISFHFSDYKMSYPFKK
jgi:hypothetical protein